jgi:quinol monooxygenase YgiN
MVTVIAHFYAKPERRDELEQILIGWPELARREPGWVDYCLHRSEDDPNVFMFYENWRSRRDFEKHGQMPYLKTFLDRRMNYLTRDIEVRSYTMLSPYNNASTTTGDSKSQQHSTLAL